MVNRVRNSELCVQLWHGHGVAGWGQLEDMWLPAAFTRDPQRTVWRLPLNLPAVLFLGVLFNC